MLSKNQKPIPLIRPLIPEFSDVAKHLKISQKANTFSNFGPNYLKAVELINKRTGRYMVPVTNGTVAIQMACLTTLPKGSRVIIPDYTHIGTYVGVRDAGMVPIIAPASPHTWTLNLSTLIPIKDTFDAIVVVSPFGYNVSIEVYEYFAKKYDKKIIYDFAGAWGQFPPTKFPVCYSLHATKGWSCGEGGLVSFYDDKEFEVCRKLTNFNINRDASFGPDIGGNYKMDEIRSAMIVSHMKNYSKIMRRSHARSNVMHEYEKHFGVVPYASSASLAVFPRMEKIKPEKLSNKFICKFYYPLLSRMKRLNHVQKISSGYDFFNGCLALPIDITKSEQALIVKEIKNALR